MRYNCRIMAFVAWLANHVFDLLQTLGLVGLLFTAHAIRQDTKERKIENLFTVTAGHREIWSKLYDKPELARILRSDIDLDAAPVSLEERLFVQFLILHLNASFEARKAGLEFDTDAVSADIREFFARPIPRFVWDAAKRYQSADL
jgi:hypothetical protein